MTTLKNSNVFAPLVTPNSNTKNSFIGKRKYLEENKVEENSFKRSKLNSFEIPSPSCVVGPRNLAVIIDTDSFLSHLLDVLNFKFQGNLVAVLPRVVLQDLDDRKRSESNGHFIRSAIRALQESMKENVTRNTPWFKSQGLDEGANVINAGFLSKEERIAQCALFYSRQIMKQFQSSTSPSNVSDLAVENILTSNIVNTSYLKSMNLSNPDIQNKTNSFDNILNNKGVVVLTKNNTLQTLCKNYNLKCFSPEEFLAMLPPIYSTISKKSNAVNTKTSSINTNTEISNASSSVFPTKSIFDLVQGPTNTSPTHSSIGSTNHAKGNHYGTRKNNLPITNNFKEYRPIRQVLTQGRDLF